ncbi:hypothetical protein [Gloeothece verrucosa]|uniref:Uncharacterized protein n=1 Tax=Gloeothece verrucosa (strain PCC 7822) TaxID=497965 RepID=E0UJN7_GLOV7|nr:hypothetical protein [Gloeothece verrucosa]ADN12281.1 conserved hypothetical protein [Gloeothece verrucosa PCC 7822]
MAIDVIVSALIAGAAKPAGEVAGDLYKALKDFIKKKLESKGKADAGYLLDKLEKKPEAVKELLKDELVEAEVDKDEEIIKKAQELLQQLKPQETPGGNINIEGGVKGVAGYNISGSTINQGDIS